MQDQLATRQASERLSWMLALAGLFTLVLAAKLILIAHFGQPVPFWDQWDSEAYRLYKPYMEGALEPQALIQPHNEHRILLTRLLGIVELEAAGQWDAKLQMVVNAALHAGFVAILARYLGACLTPIRRLGLTLFMAAVFAFPIGWENTLQGIQSSLYFCLLFSIMALICLITAKPLGGRWLLGLGCAVAAFFSQSGGALVLPAAIAVITLQIFFGVRTVTKHETIALTIMLVLGAALLMGVVTVPAHEPLKAHSLRHFLRAFFNMSTAPFPFSQEFLYLPIGLLLHIPTAILAWRMLRNPRAATASQWIVLALVAWVVLQMMAMSYGRAFTSTSSRYQDVLILLLPIDLAALCCLAQSKAIGAKTQTAWAALFVIGAVNLGFYTWPFVVMRGKEAAAQMANAAAYIRTGDKAVLEGKPQIELPYPSVERLESFLTDPTIRQLMPSSLRPADAPLADLHRRLFLKGALAPVVLGLKDALLIGAPWLALLGVGFFGFAALNVRARAHPSARP